MGETSPQSKKLLGSNPIQAFLCGLLHVLFVSPAAKNNVQQAMMSETVFVGASSDQINKLNNGLRLHFEQASYLQQSSEVCLQKRIPHLDAHSI